VTPGPRGSRTPGTAAGQRERDGERDAPDQRRVAEHRGDRADAEDLQAGQRSVVKIEQAAGSSPAANDRTIGS
jgi:hypothetical protein